MIIAFGQEASGHGQSIGDFLHTADALLSTHGAYRFNIVTQTTLEKNSRNSRPNNCEKKQLRESSCRNDHRIRTKLARHGVPYDAFSKDAVISIL